MKMKMYVWIPRSLEDYYSGMVCVIAESKRAAIKLAVAQRWPHLTKKHHRKSTSPLSLGEINTNIDACRLKFREELQNDKPQMIRRGAVHICGGG